MDFFKAEWKKVFTNKILIRMMIIIPLVPIIYSGIILSAYWDPFGKTSNLSVAVVNEDEPSELEGEIINVGEELVNTLKENYDLDWHFVSSKVARKGFDDGDYYLVITIPKDFSLKASTILDDNPEKMDLTYEVNPGRNFFSVTISEQAMNSINQKISKSVTKEYTKAIFSKVNEIGTGFADAADGADKITNGVKELGEGNKELTENLNKLASSTLTFKDGTDKIQVGVLDFIKGAEELNNGIIQYTNGVSQLYENLAPLSTKLATGQKNCKWES